MRLRFLGFPHTPTYQTTGIDPWHGDEVRDVEEALADRLLRDFPAFFTVEPDPTPEPAVYEAVPLPPEPSTDAPSVDVLTLTDRHWRTLVAEIEAGEHDAVLMDLAEADDRPSIQRAIDARCGELLA
jgi:hypothetical protein